MSFLHHLFFCYGIELYRFYFGWIVFFQGGRRNIISDIQKVKTFDEKSDTAEGNGGGGATKKIQMPSVITGGEMVGEKKQEGGGAEQMGGPVERDQG